MAPGFLFVFWGVMSVHFVWLLVYVLSCNLMCIGGCGYGGIACGLAKGYSLAGITSLLGSY